MRATHQQRLARRSLLRLLVAAPLDRRTWARAGYLLAALPIGWGVTAVMVLTLAPWALLVVLAILLPWPCSALRVRRGGRRVRARGPSSPPPPRGTRWCGCAPWRPTQRRGWPRRWP
jgi:hypothetical protein